jgi:16S rRNA processing protein RimM
VPETPIQEGYVTLARILRSRGNRGEVAAEDCSDDPLRRFTPGARFFLAGDAPRREVLLEKAWHHKGRLILKFEGIDGIAGAQALRGCEVQIPEAELGPAPEGGFFFQDLIGCRMLDADSGRELGVVRNVLEPGGTPLLEVDSLGREILVPFARSICVEIAPGERTIRVRLPEGLEELNP